MTAKTLFRIAAVVFLIFAAGHTVGFLTLKPPTPESMAVKEAMDNVHFTMQGSTFSYGGFYRGFGLSATVSMLFQAFLCWQLGAMIRLAPGGVASIGWALCMVQVAAFVMSLLYFSVPPAVLSLASGLLLAFAAIRTRSVPKTS